MGYVRTHQQAEDAGPRGYLSMNQTLRNARPTDDADHAEQHDVFSEAEQ